MQHVARLIAPSILTGLPSIIRLAKIATTRPSSLAKSWRAP
jgi:hypothetical protein